MHRILRLCFGALLLAMTCSGLRAAELVMVERDGCVWCARWNAEVAPGYAKSDEGQRAPLRRMRLEDGLTSLRLKEPVRFTPTFILIDGDREIGRIIGYLDNAMFWGLLEQLLAKIEAPKP